MKTNLRKSIVTMFLITILVASNLVTSNAKITKKTDDYSAYSAIGLRVCYVKLTAEGDTKNIR